MFSHFYILSLSKSCLDLIITFVACSFFFSHTLQFIVHIPKIFPSFFSHLAYANCSLFFCVRWSFTKMSLPFNFFLWRMISVLFSYCSDFNFIDWYSQPFLCKSFFSSLMIRRYHHRHCVEGKSSSICGWQCERNCASLYQSQSRFFTWMLFEFVHSVLEFVDLFVFCVDNFE